DWSSDVCSSDLGETGLSLQIIEDVIYQIVYFIPLNLWFFILSVVLFRCYRQLGHLLAQQGQADVSQHLLNVWIREPFHFFGAEWSVDGQGDRASSVQFCVNKSHDFC